MTGLGDEAWEREQAIWDRGQAKIDAIDHQLHTVSYALVVAGLSFLAAVAGFAAWEWLS